MPIIEDTPNTPPVEAPAPILVAKPSYQGVAVDTRYTPATSLLTHLAGSSWSVQYYSQVLDTDNTQNGQNVDTSAIYQQYKLIQNLELKVTTPLAPTQDTVTKAFTLNGQATIYPCGLIPNEGDMFVADIGDGRAGVFRITQSEMRSIFKDAAYVIDYSLINYVTDFQMIDLNNKVVEKLTYVSDFLQFGQNPLIADTDLLNRNKLLSHFDDIAADYFRRFLSREYSTLVLPGQSKVVYDPFLTRAILRAFDSENSADFKRIRELNIGEDDTVRSTTVWDALLKKKRSVLKYAARQVGLVSVVQFPANAAMESVRYSGMQYIVYPKDPELSEDDVRIGNTKLFSATNMAVSPSRLRRLVDIVPLTTLNELGDSSVIGVNPMVANGHYVFSEAFYERWSVGQSALELLVQDYLDGKVINQAVLTQLAESHASWPLLDQFYQIPVLLMMIRAAVRRM